MKNQIQMVIQATRWVRQHWVGGAALLLAVLLLTKGVPAWAAPGLAPVNQTVPDPTATPENTPVPQATNTPNDDDDPTATTAPGTEPTATTAPATGPTPTTGPAGPTPTPFDGPTGIVIADALNVRQGPATTFAVVGKAFRGETLSILARNATGDWWRICCASGTNGEGWVSAQFVQPNFDATQANTLIPVAEGETSAVITPTVTGQVVTTTVAVATPVTVTPTVTSTVPSTVTLALSIQQAPLFVWQGQPFALQFVITNTATTAALNVQLRDELPAELAFIEAEIGSGGVVTPPTGEGRYVLDVQWPQIAAGTTVTMTALLQVAASVTNGIVIDNLAVVVADNVDSTTAGISIGMPPTLLPDFQ